MSNEGFSSFALDPQSVDALAAKRSYRQHLTISASALQKMGQAETTGLTLAGPNYDSFETGRFYGLESIRLRWASPDYFEFIPRTRNAFHFERSNGEKIEPRRMFTDGGSIPRVLWFQKAFSPWGYAPAFLIHDWLFDLQHCKQSTYSFEQTRDIMMEGVKTLMEQDICPKNYFAFQALYLGINSSVARNLWDALSQGCPLPPDASE